MEIDIRSGKDSERLVRLRRRAAVGLGGETCQYGGRGVCQYHCIICSNLISYRIVINTLNHLSIFFHIPFRLILSHDISALVAGQMAG